MNQIFGPWIRTSSIDSDMPAWRSLSAAPLLSVSFPCSQYHVATKEILLRNWGFNVGLRITVLALKPKLITQLLATDVERIIKTVHKVLIL